MLMYVLFVTVAVVVASMMYLKSMRSIDLVFWVMKFMSKSGLMSFLIKTGLNRRMRPTAAEITAPNGVKFMAPNGMYGSILEPALKFKVREDDVFITTYPKAGTTWVQEITWLICNNADIDGAKQKPIPVRSGFMESVDIDTENKGLQSLETWPTNDQRIIKAHLPYELLPEELFSGAGEKCKIIYVARNPKDLCVSFYYFHLMNFGLPDPGTWSEFLTNFCSGNIGWGSWFSHTLKYWEKSQEDKRIYFTTYETLKKDLRGELVLISRFLEKDLTDEQLDSIADHCTFESMSKNSTANYSHAKKYGWDFKKSKFMRKGQVGDWKNHFTLSENAAFDELYEEKMKGTGLVIPFELDC